jgi:hypothetical protein
MSPYSLVGHIVVSPKVFRPKDVEPVQRFHLTPTELDSPLSCYNLLSTF